MEDKRLTTYGDKSKESLRQGYKWDSADESGLVKKYAALLAVQRTYGQSYDIQVTLKGWKYFLSDYSIDQILSAMDTWVKLSPDMPTPSDIIKILSPKKELSSVEKELQRAREGKFIC